MQIEVVRPLDGARPLWEAVLVDGLHRGRVAVLIKMSHAVIDPIGAVNQFSALFDREPDVDREPLPPVPIPADVARDVLGPRNSAVARPGAVDVAVLPPIAVGDSTTENVHSRIEGVRRQFLETVKHWPGPFSL